MYSADESHLLGTTTFLSKENTKRNSLDFPGNQLQAEWVLILSSWEKQKGEVATGLFHLLQVLCELTPPMSTQLVNNFTRRRLLIIPIGNIHLFL